MYAYFERFTLQMTLTQAESASHVGECESDVRDLIKYTPSIQRQLRKIPADLIRDELREYGAWDSEELSDDEMNQVRIVWLAAGSIHEENATKKRGGIQ